MRNPNLLVLCGLVVPLTLSQSTLSGCLPTSSTVSGGTGGSVFNLSPTVRIDVVPDPAIGVAPLTVQFNSSDSTDDGVIVDRLWSFGDGTTSRDISPTHIFQLNGTYTVRLTLTDDGGATSSRSMTVTVTERPVAVIQVGSDTADEAPATFLFDGTQSYDPDGLPGEALTYSWVFGDGARETLASVAHTYSRAGTYRAQLTVTDKTGVTGTAEKYIQVGIPRPVVEFRTPPSSVHAMVMARDPNASQAAPVWVQVVFSVESGVPYRLRAGLRESISNRDYVLDENAADGIVANDLPLTLPTALDISQVPFGTYNLWAEVLTDRSAPSRTYASAVVHLVSPFTNTVTADTPSLPPLTNEEWYVFPVPISQRQIFDLGAVSLGDRLFVSLLNAPGLDQVYDQPGFSLLMLDASQKMYAWYQGSVNDILPTFSTFEPPVLFTPDARLIVGHSSTHLYCVSEGRLGTLAPNVYVRVQRAAAPDSSPRKQVVYLDFDGTAGGFIAVANSVPFHLSQFSLRSTASDTTVINSAVARVTSLLAAYNFDVMASTPAAPVAAPTGPHLTIHFDTEPSSTGLMGVVNANQLKFFGLADYLDPRASSASGFGVVAARELDSTMQSLGISLSDSDLGGALGNAAVHQIGFLVGLRETTGVNSDIMIRLAATATSDNRALARDPGLNFSVANLAPAAGQSSAAIGIQDAPQLLQELFRR